MFLHHHVNHYSPPQVQERQFEALDEIEILESDSFLTANTSMSKYQISKYKKYILPIDETILQVYNNYVKGHCHNRKEFLKVMSMLRDVRKKAIKACGMN